MSSKAEYVITGKCIVSRGHDRDKITRIEEELFSVSVKQARKRFKQVLDYHKGLKTGHDNDAAYDRIELGLMLGDEIIDQVNLRYESVRVQFLCKPGRGWISD
jgi:hypothetical protein